MELKKNLARITEIVTSVDMETPEFLRSVVPPTYSTTVFRYTDFDMAEAHSAGKIRPHTYSRTDGNPTNECLHRMMANMENAEAAMAVASGTTAIFTAMISCLKAGDHVVIDGGAYGRAQGFLCNEFARFGVTHTRVSLKEPGALEDALRPETTLIYLESPNSWFFELQDIRHITKIARERGITTILDNTYSTPVFQNPVDLGVDVVLHSATKYLGGHSNVIAGIIVSTRKFIDSLSQVEGKLSAREASELLVNLRTLPLRMERHQETARRVCFLLENSSRVKTVFWPGSEHYPQKDLFKSQMYGASGTMSFVLDCDREGTRRFINALRIVNLGGTWGTYETTIQTTDTNPNYHRELFGLLPHHCRISVGLEDADALLEDLDSALRKI